MKQILQFFKSKSITSEPDFILKVPPEIEQLNNYSMSGIRVLKKLYILGQDILNRSIPGDFVECGVCNGGSAAAIALSLRSTGRKVWLYDSFLGMPETKEVDGLAAAKYVGRCVGAEEKVREAMEIAGFANENYIIRKGWFQDSFQAPLPQAVSLLHIDADWYDSVMLSLNTFYDLVPEGGIIILDDFGHWEGCREAFYDFTAQRGIKPLLERFGHTQIFWVKERSNNREFAGKWYIP
ncbi:TylF/MycF family methyltransferase [Dolichospermum sp. ST_sed1]|nr:TylF/MycF family methyltransferase [Dolichospermum sp. ST_sed1]MDD1424243.1 TylF/MycF family methyltransferase [Dolichospermum sp. ST_sed9]MDD1429759.1 TylF/MycF family methyltransferase [Dolichospermum sp. ST_sed6]MDD1440557.1 TylF/MycF family methyltransferase [Dolichospermum sp. ST_sed3]MDD1446113.1 TylF/MycF family methyltransferase [Dolichospermum sp. ST_sed8]MDD1454731.1 TylF/MycF family methyltransferase [Dolichospermum sp. ST_sed7]MDD1459613.1 TylF/MycF family methyltransferase [Do